MTNDNFDARLRADLPRGQSAPTRSAGRDRGLSARWLTADEMTGDVWQYDRHGLLLGRRAGRLIGWKDNRHVLTLAGSRAGKGVSLIVPNLALYEGSVLVVDPKGENARITATHRGRGTRRGGPGLGQNVHVLDPFRVSGVPSASFNPLAELDLRSDEVAEDAAMFADALIMHRDEGERHWTESAQGLVRALILVALSELDPSRRNLVTVRRLLTLTDKAIRDVQYDVHSETGKEASAYEALIAILRGQKGKPYGYICVGMAEQLEGMGEEERGSVFSEARTQTQWLDDRRIKRVLCHSDFRIADLKRKKTTIYLCLPAMRMSTHARWLRLMILLAMSVMERSKVKPPAPVLFVLDEFPVLGHMQSIETAAGVMAGFSVKLWVIVQNIGQLKKHYEKTWQTFVANAGVVTAFGVSDQESLTELSHKLGRMRMLEQVSTGVVGEALVKGGLGLKDDHFDTPLLAEHEIERIFEREKNRLLILGAGHGPAVAERFIWHDPNEPLFEALRRAQSASEVRKWRSDSTQ